MPYDPVAPGRFTPAGFSSEAKDDARGRTFPVTVWYPQDRGGGGALPLIVFSHYSGGNRRASSFLCSHLAAHGYVVAALDHSEIIAPELAPRSNETATEKGARGDAWIASRVPDIRLLLDHMTGVSALPPGVSVDTTRTGIVGHSLGGWTSLAAAQADARIASVVALAPAGSAHPKPGILAPRLSFERQGIPVLYIVAEDDVSLPIDGMRELFARTPGPKRWHVLPGADHLHFIDNVEHMHEMVRAMKFSGELAWINEEMRPAAELMPGAQAHEIIRSFTTAHFDATLRGSAEAALWLDARET